MAASAATTIYVTCAGSSLRKGADRCVISSEASTAIWQRFPVFVIHQFCCTSTNFQYSPIGAGGSPVGDADDGRRRWRPTTALVNVQHECSVQGLSAVQSRSAHPNRSIVLGRVGLDVW